jgi:hypothetical protein
VSRKKVLGVLLLVGAVAAAVTALLPAPGGDQLPSTKPGSSAPRAQQEKDATVDVPARGVLGDAHANLFTSRERAPRKPPPPVAAPPPPPTPAAPPMTYRVAGQVVVGGKAEVLLAKGDRTFTARPGETLEDGFRVERIEPNRVTLVYVPLGTSHTLPVASALVLEAPRGSPRAPAAAPQKVATIPPGPAQLRWLGPERVTAGRPFEVVLKLTSAKPVGASPLELSYDAKLLEPVAVRAGAFFAGGKFSYRVAPGGSILVGATNAAAAAADADFLVLTFKPLRGDATAELKLSSVELTDGAGTEVEHVPPQTFRTSIIR